jgi:asparagine synthase (glutamine-hydrolysing)
MCGIAGQVSFSHGPDEDGLAPVMARLAHRGPDHAGLWRGRRCVLGHTRLAILDLNPRSNQPMLDPATGNVIAFNGEIYNFKELRAGLEQRGHVFRTTGDTEVLLALYRVHGPECVRMLRGMFAFALWDEAGDRLVLARDRLGKKPLVYARTGRGLVFASEVQALAAHPGVDQDVDLEGLDLYLSLGHIPAPRSIHQGIRKLLPAHYAVVSRTGMETVRYWELDYRAKSGLDGPEALDAVEAELTEAVRIRLESDVPLGALLSGGVDSSLVVAVMARLSATPVQAFTIGFAEKKYDELPYARQVAAHLGIEHHHEILPAATLEDLDQVVAHYGEPYADASALASFRLTRMARSRITVALNGDGGDELACGYSSYRHARAASALNRLVRLGPAPDLVLGRLAGAASGPGALARRLLHQYVYPEYKFLLRDEQALLDHKRELYTPEAWAGLEGKTAAWLRSWADASFAHADNPVERLLWIDNSTSLPDGLLVKMDIASMAHALEVRSPLLDHRLVELVAGLPVSLKVRGRETKYLLKKIAERYLPAPLLYRRKQGFALPVGEWLAGPMSGYMRDVFAQARPRLAGYLRTEAVDRLVEEHVTGKRNHKTKLWRLLNLALWEIGRGAGGTPYPRPSCPPAHGGRA